MGSEWNMKNEDSATTYQPSQPSLCTNGCGFFGTAATEGLCSKCHRDRRLQQETESALNKSFNDMKLVCSASTAVDLYKSSSSTVCGSLKDPVLPALAESQPCLSKRCGSCNKRVGLATGFQCKCGITFCGTHRYAEAHQCSFDYKASGRDKLAKANPLIKADKQSDTI